MQLVATLAVAPGDPQKRPAEVNWTDAERPGAVTFYYRLAAMDQAGNESAPSSVVAGRAYDQSPPPAPVWTRLEWVRLDESGNEHPFMTPVPKGEVWRAAVALRWATPAKSQTFLQRRGDEQVSWRPASGWIQSTEFDPAHGLWLYRFYDTSADSTTSLWYRLKVESLNGNMNGSFDERKLVAP